VKTYKKTLRMRVATGFMVIFGLAACADLNVVNLNDPDSERALATAGDVESLIAGSFGQWWSQAHSVSGNPPILGNQTFMWTGWPANFGMFDYSHFPRPAVANISTDQFYGNTVNYSWSQLYRAASAIAQGLRALDDPDLAAELGPERIRRLEAYGKFVQGLVHGSLALLYDEAFIVDENTDVANIGSPVPYSEMLTASLGYFDEAIALANQGGFPALPSSWMTVSVQPAELARLAHSMKARYRANVARTPAERAALNWAAVIADADAGVTSTWFMNTEYFGPAAEGHYTAAYMSQPTVGWSQASYWMFGMADQSGMYQDWLSFPILDRRPNFPNGSPRLIITPDRRFPQGATEAQQVANPGMKHTDTPSPFMIIGPKSWGQPARGSHRWSHYRVSHMDFHRTMDIDTPTPEITMAEMRLLKAEGHYRNNNRGEAANLINVTRTAAGLNPTNAAGLNTSCVPKLPNGSCGDLLEMLKWEKRLETMVWGVHTVSWYFDGRGWGDLYEGTQTQFPIPCLEREILLQDCNTYGGDPGAPGSAPRSTYAFPG